MQIGEICVLKSGGPPMTIDNISSNTGGVRCVWFTQEGEFKEGWFAGNSVIVAPTDYRPLFKPTKNKK